MNVHGKRPPALDSLTIFRSPSPPLDYFAQTTSSMTRQADPKAQLLERWRNIADYIASTRMSWDSVIALNRNLDTVENILLSRAPIDEDWKASKDGFGLGISSTVDYQLGVQCETTPPVSDAPGDVDGLNVEKRGFRNDEGLLGRVTKAVAQLRERHHEFKHLHDMAILRSEREADSIHRVKSQADQLQKDIADDESELTYLKLQLRIIEIQTLPYVPQKDRDSLAAGIQRWKLDWAEVDNRYRKRRWKRQVEKQDWKPMLSIETQKDRNGTVSMI